MNNTDFNYIKERVQKLIYLNKDKELSRESVVESSGIYMLYVDNFSDDKIIPFYIGQTSNFQERYKQHLCELLSLNRLQKECYEYALLKGLYDGRYRACKIYSYMINHNCTLNNFHMIILNEVDDETIRLELENNYINNLLAPFFGFNQLQCVSEYKKQYVKNNYSEYYENIVNQDVSNLIKYREYGYSLFNGHLAKGLIRDVNEQMYINLSSDTEYLKYINKKEQWDEIEITKGQLKYYNNYEAVILIEALCKNDIEDYFKKCKLRSKDKQELIIKVLLFDDEKDERELSRYFNRYSERCSESIIDMLEKKYTVELNNVREKLLNNQEEYNKLEKERLEIFKFIFSSLLAKKNYSSHPLKDLHNKYEFKTISISDNVCYINVEYTCFRDNYNYDLYPEICKIDYLIYKNNNIYTKSCFTENSLSSFMESDSLFYMESGFRSGPFSPSIVGNVDTYIPITMEYRNGINEYTLAKSHNEKLDNVLKEIDSIIDSNTKIIYTTSGYKSSIKNYAEIPKYKDITLLQKLKKLCK